MFCNGNHQYCKWLDKIAERASEHSIEVFVSWSDISGLVVEDCNNPLLTDDDGSLLIGKGFQYFDDGEDFERLLDRLDGVEDDEEEDDADDDTANDDEQTNTPAQVTKDD